MLNVSVGKQKLSRPILQYISIHIQWEREKKLKLKIEENNHFIMIEYTLCCIKNYGISFPSSHTNSGKTKERNELHII